MTTDDGATARRSAGLFDDGLYCAESVLLAVAERLRVDSPVIPRIATGFCSGLARTGGTCGAVTGAVMALGLATGRDRPDDDVVPTYEAVQMFLDRFREQSGALDCPGLIGVDIGTPEGRAAFAQQGLHDRCREFVEGATAIVAEILEVT